MQRDVSIDVVRGLCIFSMVIAHLSYGSPLSRVVNVSSLVDGASGFFLLSGLVVGIVYERYAARMTVRQAQRKLVRRAGMLYVVHVVLIVMVMAIGSRFAAGHEWADAAVLGGWGPTLLGTFTLRFNPSGFGILSVYVPLMLMAAVIVPLLRAGRTTVAATTVVAVYGASVAWPTVFTLPEAPGAGGFWNWGGWQALFFAGVFVGWYWRRASLRDRLLSARGFVLSVAGMVGGFLLWRAMALGALQPLLLGLDGEDVRWVLFAKGAMGPMRLVVAMSTMAVLYHLATIVRERDWLTHPMAFTARIGRKSLDSFVISRFFVMALPLWPTFDPATWAGSAVAVLSLLAAWVWATFREDGLAPVTATQARVRAALPRRVQAPAP